MGKIEMKEAISRNSFSQVELVKERAKWIREIFSHGLAGPGIGPARGTDR